MSDSTDDFLEHYGVPGMKWGRRRGRSSDGGTGKNGKATTYDVLLARQAQAARLRKLQEAEGDFYVARTNKGQDKAEKIMRRYEKDYFTNPDAKMAAKMTRGEKVTAGVLYGLAATILVSHVAVAVSGSKRL